MNIYDEALKELKEIYDGMYNKLGFVKEFKSIEQALLEAKKQLEAPTSEEVCEAVQSDLHCACYYDVLKIDFYVVELFENGEVERGMSIKEIQIEAFSPSTLILIGRFYEKELGKWKR